MQFYLFIAMSCVQFVVVFFILTLHISRVSL